MFKMLQTGADFIYSLLFPPFCLNCGRQGEYVCPECHIFLTEAEPACPACGKASSGARLHQRCFSFLDRRLVAWENQGLAKRLIAAVNQGRATHLLEYLILQALAIFLKNDSYDDLGSILSDNSVEIVSVPSSQETESRSGLSGFFVQQLCNIFRSKQSQNQADGSEQKQAILVSLEDHVGIKSKAQELKESGFDQVFSLVLVG